MVTKIGNIYATQPRKGKTDMKKLVVIGALCLLPTLAIADENVRGYTRKDGTYVEPYRRTTPDHSPYNNYNFPGNFNPNTGKESPGNADTYKRNYDNNSSPFGTLHQPHQPFGK